MKKIPCGLLAPVVLALGMCAFPGPADGDSRPCDEGDDDDDKTRKACVWRLLL
jgi:hypothetical protein